MCPDKESQFAQLLEPVAEREVYQFPGRNIRGGFSQCPDQLGAGDYFHPSYDSSASFGL